MKSITPARIFALGCLGLVWAAPVAAQHRLFVEEPDGNWHAVVKVSGVQPYIGEKGGAVAAKGRRLALKHIEEYLPILIAIRDKESGPTNLSVDFANAPANKGVHFSAKFESADPLEDVFLVLELEISNVGKKIFAYEVGTLEPRTPKAFSADLPLGEYMGAGQLEPHLFVGGTEVFTSELSEADRTAALDQMVAKRISGVQQGALRPLYGVPPAYPPALRQSGLKGEAVITMSIDARGAVIDPVVERSSEEAFGREALNAIRQWRFVPRVAKGQAVATKVSIPFAFDPPPPSRTKD